MRSGILCLFIVLTLLSCNEYTPKPKGYQRVMRQPVEYIEFSNTEFSFLYPNDACIESLISETKPEIWFSLHYKQYNATLHCTYIPLLNQDLNKILDDSYRLAYSHVSMAQGISQAQFSDSLRHTFGIIYDIQGSVASPVQFYITDNTSNFLRGSLYFDQTAKADSIAQVVSFVRNDIVHIMESLEWKRR
jgi:gliding motility-associated lipoprotein GldD